MGKQNDGPNQQGREVPHFLPLPFAGVEARRPTHYDIGGELVVDYAINIKKIFGQETFVMGYSNDVMTYIPSTTILREGGYEGEVAAIVYGLPATWASDVEIEILNGIVQLAKQAGVTKPESRVIKN
jgi:neutral ceramidase